MIDIDSLSVLDLFSFRDVSRKFEDGITSIVGVNKDQSGTLSNGAGKSSFMDSILYVLFGEGAKDTPLNEVVRESSKSETVESGEATLTLSRDDTTYTIRRGRILSPEDSFLIITENDVDFKFRRLADGQAKILSILGVPEGVKYKAADFLKTNYFSKSELELFASNSVTPSERMKIVSDALSLQKVAAAITKANKEILSIEKDLLTTQASIDVLTGRLVDSAELQSKFEIASEQLRQIQTELNDLTTTKAGLDSRLTVVTKAKELWISHRSDLTLNESKQRAVNTSTAELEVEYSNFEMVKQDLADKKSKLEAYDIQTVKDLKKDSDIAKSLYQQQGKTLEVEKANIERRGKEIQAALSGAINCPQCGAGLRVKDGQVSPFDKDSLMHDWESLRSEAAAFAEKVQTHNRELEDLDKARKSMDQTISDYDILKATIDQIQKQVDNTDLNAKSDKLNNELKTLRTEHSIFMETYANAMPNEFILFDNLSNFDDLIDYLDKAKKQYGSVIQTTTDKENAAKLEVSRIKDKIEENNKTKSELEEHRKKHSTSTTQLSLLTGIVELFNEFRRELIRQFVPLFETTSNQYLKEMGFDYLIRLELERLKADGEFKPELVILVNDGIAWRSFNSYSEGEKVRVGLACQFALMDIAGTRTVNLVLLDEVLDSLDRVGFQSFLKVCKRLGSRVLVTSRLSADEIGSGSDRIIQIVKENGVSVLI